MVMILGSLSFETLLLQVFTTVTTIEAAYTSIYILSENDH